MSGFRLSKLGLGLSKGARVSAGSGGGGEELPEAPEGFAYLVNANGEYLVNADGAYILAKV